MKLSRVRASSAAAMIALLCASCSDDNDGLPADASTPHADGGSPIVTVDGGMDASTGLDAALTDDQQKAALISGVHDALLTDLNNLVKATQDLQAAAPVTTGRGWDATLDATAMTSMRDAWTRARTAYEHIEGALAPLFPDLDASLDARYDDFLATIGPAGDQNLFDDQGVTGLHAQERIMWAKETRASVITFEASLPGYKAAAWPATEQEASDFKNKLCAKAVTDAQNFLTSWNQPNVIALGEAFRGLVSLMNEQREKVNKAASNEEESRYSQTTMNDIRDNLEGTKTVYELFSAWLVTKPAAVVVDGGQSVDGKQTNADIEAGFATLATLYAADPGAAIPAVPATWSAESPSTADLASPFGLLWSGVRAATNLDMDPSITRSMNHAAALLGFPEFEEEE